jgi:hypothetical protein
MAAIGILWAFAWAEAYFTLRDLEVGCRPWHLHPVWARGPPTGCTAIFFFLIGLELKREFVAGDLRRFSTAIVPVVAAAGVIIPALVYVAIVADSGLLRGWAIPTATDIAFAVAVLGSRLGPLRIFLLTLAVVDDLIAISIIAIFTPRRSPSCRCDGSCSRSPCTPYSQHIGSSPPQARRRGGWSPAHRRVAWAFVHASRHPRHHRRRAARPPSPSFTAAATGCPTPNQVSRRSSSTVSARSPPGSPYRCSHSSSQGRHRRAGSSPAHRR